ncbi:hypothetical protein ACFL6P_10210 [Candidatus Latescibacterota bacterium]
MHDEQKIDFWLLSVTMILAGIGLVMVYSSSMYLSGPSLRIVSFICHFFNAFISIGPHTNEINSAVIIP